MATRIINISIPKITESPFQGRFFNTAKLENKHAKKLFNKLVISIEKLGLMQPIAVRQTGDNYELIDGHRRVAAYRQLGKGNIPAIVKEASDKDTQVMSVVANLQRSNLSNLEKAMAFEKIMNDGIFKSQKELSKAIGKDETYVGDILNLLKLDKRILEHLALNQTSGDVRLLRIIRKVEKVNKEGLSEKQYKLYLRYIHQNLSRQQLQKEIDKQSGAATEKNTQIAITPKGFNLQINKKLNKTQKEQFKILLEQKMTEALEDILQNDQN